MTRILEPWCYLFLFLVAVRCQSTNNNTTPGNISTIDEDTEARITKANNEFGIKLYGKLPKEGNVFMSPLTTFTVLSMIHHGAKGKTLEEIRQALQFDAYGISDDDTCEGFQKIFAYLNNDVNYTLDFFGTAFLEKNYPENATRNYITRLKQCYDSDVQGVTFSNCQEVVEKVNHLVNATTRGQIDEFLKEPLDSLTRLFLLSVVYFKGLWNTTFPKRLSYEGTFFNDGVMPVNVTMMRLRGHTVRYMHDTELGLAAVELPYRNDESSMVIILPRNETDLPGIEASLDLKTIESILEQMWDQELGDLEIPKFHIEGDYPELKDQLKEMGMKSMFHEEDADLSGINSGIEPLFVSKFLHKSVIDVDEEGSVASGASGGSIGTRIGAFRPISFVVDHPFLFLIRDLRNGLLLFMGRVSQL